MEEKEYSQRHRSHSRRKSNSWTSVVDLDSGNEEGLQQGIRSLKMSRTPFNSETGDLLGLVWVVRAGSGFCPCTAPLAKESIHLRGVRLRVNVTLAAAWLT
jgi:hypothetical protein